MSGHDYELLTVRDAALGLMKSEKGVRRLIQRGKLNPLRKGRRYLIPLEEVRRYAASLPHPIPIMAALYDAQQILALHQAHKRAWAGLLHAAEYRREVGALNAYFMPEAVPLCEGIVAAARVRNYSRVEALALDLHRVRVDYQMAHAPLKPHQDEGQEKSLGMGLLFSEGGAE